MKIKCDTFSSYSRQATWNQVGSFAMGPAAEGSPPDEPDSVPPEPEDLAPNEDEADKLAPNNNNNNKQQHDRRPSSIQRRVQRPRTE